MSMNLIFSLMRKIFCSAQQAKINKVINSEMVILGCSYFILEYVSVCEHFMETEW